MTRKMDERQRVRTFCAFCSIKTLSLF